MTDGADRVTGMPLACGTGTTRSDEPTLTRIARKDVERNDRLCRYRRVVERMHVRFAGMGTLRTQFECPVDIHPALPSVACRVVCAWRFPIVLLDALSARQSPSRAA